jgi:hypothetical protein
MDLLSVALVLVIINIVWSLVNLYIINQKSSAALADRLKAADQADEELFDISTASENNYVWLVYSKWDYGKTKLFGVYIDPITAHDTAEGMIVNGVSDSAELVSWNVITQDSTTVNIRKQ